MAEHTGQTPGKRRKLRNIENAVKYTTNTFCSVPQAHEMPPILRFNLFSMPPVHNAADLCFHF